MSRLLLLVALLIVAGCTTRPHGELTMRNINPEWNPPGGIEQAEALCDAQVKAAPREEVMRGVYLDSSPQRQRSIYRSCMKTYGFELRDEKGCEYVSGLEPLRCPP